MASATIFNTKSGAVSPCKICLLQNKQGTKFCVQWFKVRSVPIYFLEDTKDIADLSREVADACKQAANIELKEANTKLMSAIENQRLLEKMAEFDAKRDQHPLFKVTRQYMRMVMEMLQFIRAVRMGDWKLHLQALQIFTKYTRSSSRMIA